MTVHTSPQRCIKIWYTVWTKFVRISTSIQWFHFRIAVLGYFRSSVATLLSAGSIPLPSAYATVGYSDAIVSRALFLGLLLPPMAELSIVPGFSGYNVLICVIICLCHTYIRSIVAISNYPTPFLEIPIGKVHMDHKLWSRFLRCDCVSVSNVTSEAKPHLRPVVPSAISENLEPDFAQWQRRAPLAAVSILTAYNMTLKVSAWKCVGFSCTSTGVVPMSGAVLVVGVPNP
jgi:hypothetical protein